MTKIFVLGDSRTGTTSIHRFLQVAGFKSIHFYFKESGVRQNNEAAQPVGEETEDNWVLLKRFIDTSGYDAFSDYPTRTFYQELIDEYPDAYFILTCRKDIETWQKSMKAFMGKFGFELNLPASSKAHLRVNEDIRKLAAERNVKLCEIDIDAPSSGNAVTLSKFLNLPDVVQLGRENASSSYDLRLWSARSTLYDLPDGDVVDYVEKSCAPHKGMLSEYGWVFLANDSSDYLQYLFGQKSWSDEDKAHALSTLKTRRETLKEQNIVYRKYVIPEKSAVYTQFMPKVFSRLEVSNERPAQLVSDSNVDGFSYPAEMLRDASSHGLLYFKGDSHANWLGAYFIYHHIIETMNADVRPPRIKPAAWLRNLQPKMIGYAGDLATQLSPEHQRVVAGTWRPISFEKIFEYTIQFTLPPGARKAKPVDVPQLYLDHLGERPTFRFKHPNSNLPRAVIFRDSTADWLIELLAEHFSESLFIWHKGQVYEDIIEREKPDVVLHIMAERFFVQYRAFPPFAKLLPPDAPPTTYPEQGGATASRSAPVAAGAALPQAQSEGSAGQGQPGRRRRRSWRQLLRSPFS